MSLLKPVLVVEAQVLHVDHIPTRTGADGTVYKGRSYAWLWSPGQAPDRAKIADALVDTFAQMEPLQAVTARVETGTYEGRDWFKIVAIEPAGKR